MWANLDQDIVWESNDVKLLGVTLDSNLRLDKHVSNICLKAKSKLSALSRVAKFVPFKRRCILFKVFIESQYKYCPLVWLFHGRQINDKINKLNERAIRIVYIDAVTSFEDLLIKDKSFTILLLNVNTVFKEQNSISYFGLVIWNSIPFELRKASSYQIFRSEIKQWRPTNCPCRLCKNYIGNLGFINTSSQLVRYIVECIFYLIADLIHCVDSV